MAMAITVTHIGIDVAKDELVVCREDQDGLITLDNTSAAIRRWLKSLPANCAIAIEATSTYHVDVTEQAYGRGHRVFVIDGYQLHNYRNSVGGRAKTDACDARLLTRYLVRESQDLRAWTPPPKAYRTLQSLLRRRAALVKARIALQQSGARERQLDDLLPPLLEHMERIDRALQKRLRTAVREAGLSNEVARCQAIEGVGPLTATGLVMAFLRGEFRSADAFIAFLGLDVRVRDSGKQRGRRKLTKKGDPEIRRLLHNAAMAARRSSQWAAIYQGYLDRGLKTTQALVILARKLARIAFALMKNKTDYQPKSLLPA